MRHGSEGQAKEAVGGFGYLILVIIAFLVAFFIVLPIGLEVASVFQRLTDAFKNGK